MSYQLPPAAERTEVLDLHHPQEIVAFLIRKWAKELGGRLMRELWAWSNAKIAIHFACERLAGAGTWIRSRRNKNEKFGANGLMKLRLVSVGGFPINTRSNDGLGSHRPSRRGSFRAFPLFVRTQVQEEAGMNDKSDRSTNKLQKKARSARLPPKDAKWHRTDEQLDDALRQTFPASDAISIVQSACGD
jgi:nuclear transport factor 2 (NTF2) superfamily protein